MEYIHQLLFVLIHFSKWIATKSNLPATREMRGRALQVQLARKEASTKQRRISSARSLGLGGVLKLMLWMSPWVPAKMGSRVLKGLWKSFKRAWQGTKPAQVGWRTTLGVGRRAIVQIITRRAAEFWLLQQKAYKDKIQPQTCKWVQPNRFYLLSKVHLGLLGQSYRQGLHPKIF